MASAMYLLKTNPDICLQSIPINPTTLITDTDTITTNTTISSNSSSTTPPIRTTTTPPIGTTPPIKRKHSTRRTQPSDASRAMQLLDNFFFSFTPTNCSLENRLRASWNLAMTVASSTAAAATGINGVASSGKHINSIVIIYASQTGTAEAIAKHIHCEALLRGFVSLCVTANDLHRVPWSENNVLVFVTSTAGDGACPDNALGFWRWIGGSTSSSTTVPVPASALASKPYTILGLGDTNYTNFCMPAKRLDRRLIQLGGRSILAKALADACVGIELTVDPWVERLWTTLERLVTRDAAKAAAFDADQLDSNLCASTVQLQMEDLSLSSSHKKPSSRPRSFVRLARLSLASLALHPLSHTPLATTDSSLPTAATIVGSLDDDPLNDDNSSDSSDSSPFSADCYSPRPMHIINLDLLATSAKLTGLAKTPIQLVQVTPTGTSRPSLPITSLLSITDTNTSIDTDKSSLFGFPAVESVFHANSPFSAKIASVRCISGKRALDKVLEMELDISGADWSYLPGDAFGVLAPNPAELVRGLLERLDLGTGDQMVDVSSKQAPGLLFSCSTTPTYFEILTYFIELHALPKKSFFRLLAGHTSDTEDKRRLLFLASTQGTESYRALRAQQPTLLDILSTFPSCSPPFSSIIDCLGRLQPRFYSLSGCSSPLAPSRIRFAFNVVSYSVLDSLGASSKPVRGLCSSWLDTLTGCTTSTSPVDVSGLDLTIPIFPRASNGFHLPQSVQSCEDPLVFVAAGTGLSPFMGFLQSLAHLKRSSPDTYIERPVWLVHGHRFSGVDGDGLYDAEIQILIRDGVITKYIECLSRGDDSLLPGSGYVQEGLTAHSQDLWELMHNSHACIYLCGSLSVGKGVHDMLVGLVCNRLGVGAAEAVKVLNGKIADNKYIREVWG
ncbi:hypothetical protein BASA61_004803 [Batrachochytrium salamandrivorans]|nr:hypothetical protein BASA62_006128 [Batrachochytrium salamandrivorans]KAH6575924.1 hypothetical protein BASA60_004741 [Batrachochytrium salamandrivorans]KAH6591722.1 hypothetical protein BASA61_004803 [Batrachochytrium salamandrivorans]KAH9265774.1 hypothetical protein BASA84_001424 [Batrachochytrium salamandrivorans]